MPVKAVGMKRRVTDQWPSMEAIPSTGLCSLDMLARILSTLLRQIITPGQANAKLLSLGLLRCTDEPPLLTCQTASRLLLAGYRLPAQIEPGGWKLLQDRLRSRLQLLAPLGGPSSVAPLLYQIHGVTLLEENEPHFSVGVPEAAMTEVRLWPASRFEQAWSAADGLMITASHGWADLRGERSFFGGHREADGSYYWDVAECVTDAQGRILRC